MLFVRGFCKDRRSFVASGSLAEPVATVFSISRVKLKRETIRSLLSRTSTLQSFDASFFQVYLWVDSAEPTMTEFRLVS